jgi:hypothetical protein
MDSHVDGTVYDAQTNQMISNAHVILTSQQTTMTYDVYTDGSGYYSVTAPYGTYDAHVEVYGYDPADMVITLDQPSLTQDFSLTPTFSSNVCQLEGYVRGDTPSPSSSSGSGMSTSEPQFVPISDVRLVFTNSQTNTMNETYTDGNGHFIINLPYGSYTVLLEKSGYSTGNEGLDVFQPSATRDFELSSDDSGGGDGSGDGDGGSGSGDDSSGFSDMFGELSSISITVFASLMLCVIAITIIISLVRYSIRIGWKQGFVYQEHSQQHEPPPRQHQPPPPGYRPPA